ncbi:MAG: hypothetical protein H6705_21455, partial [Myxococcales bacterium]|nr:hypothetical protein [Myxococcales bacterium]
EARRHGWPKVLARALVDRAWDAGNRGDHDAAYARMDEAASIAAELGDGTLLANCRRNQGVFLLDRGERERVEALLGEALSTYLAGGHPVGAALTRVNLAQLARRYGRHDEALAHLDAAEALFAEASSRWGAAMVLTERGLVHHEAGALDRAEAELGAACARYAVIGGVNAPLATLYLARVHLARGRAEDARGALAGLLDRFAAQKRHGRALLTVLALLEVAAVQADWPLWDDQLDVARGLLEQLDLHTRDGARLAEDAALRAEAAGEGARAVAAWQLAHAQWKALGVEAEVRRVAERLGLPA